MVKSVCLIGDYIDWVPKIAGVEIDEWASWNAAMFEPNMISAYQFNATSGSTIDSFGVFDLTAIGVSRGHIGKNNFSFNLDGDND